MESSDYLTALRRAIDDGSVRAELDYGKLDHVDSPIVVQAEKTRWIYAIMALALAAGWFLGWGIGVAVALAGVLLYVVLGRRLIRKAMRQRFDRLALHDINQFRRLWRLPGVVLIRAQDGARCESPGGNWVRFMMAHLAVPEDAPGDAAPRA